MRRYVSELKENEQLDERFFIADKVQATDKNGRSFLTVKLADRTGSVDAKIWDRVDLLAPQFDKGEFARVRGTVTVFNGSNQVKIADIHRIPEDGVDMDDFTPDSPCDIPALWSELLALGDSITDTYLARLFTAVFVDDTELAARFRTFPAAKSLHHAYKGGLLDHSLNVARLADDLCKRYPFLNRDIMIFSALYHDLGKIQEFSYRLVADYTDEGKLIGHIVLADEMLVRKASAIEGFPPVLLMCLRHILLSHHGEYEFGSPKKPKTSEAMALHFLDNLDAKLHEFNAAVTRDVQQGSWTPMIKSLERPIFRQGYQSVAAGQEPLQAPQTAVKRDDAGTARKQPPEPFNPVFKKLL